MRFGFLALALMALLSACGGGGQPPASASPNNASKAASGDLVVEDFTIDTEDKNIKLFIRNKRPAEYYGARPDRTVLFLHGATFPGTATFDLALDNTSWMDWMAKRGYDVYVLDVRGYGKSGKPAALGQDASANPPQVTTEEALKDVARAAEFITSRRSLDRLVVVGWSWGATLAGSYAGQAGNRVERLVLYSPPWLREDGKPAPETPAMGAWRTVSLAAIKERWLNAVPQGQRSEIVPGYWQDAMLAALKATDGATANDIKVPNGVMADYFTTWGAGKPAWNPSKVTQPTLVIQGEWDTETPPHMGLGVYSALSKTATKRYVMIGQGTHMIALERNRLHLFRAVQSFIEEKL